MLKAFCTAHAGLTLSCHLIGLCIVYLTKPRIGCRPCSKHTYRHIGPKKTTPTERGDTFGKTIQSLNIFGLDSLCADTSLSCHALISAIMYNNWMHMHIHTPTLATEGKTHAPSASFNRSTCSCTTIHMRSRPLLRRKVSGSSLKGTRSPSRHQTCTSLRRLLLSLRERWTKSQEQGLIAAPRGGIQIA